MVTKTPEGYGSNTLPTIASGVMNWNNCILDKVTVKTTLYNDKTEVLDTKVFDVVLKEPIAFDSWKFYGGSKIEVSTTKEATFNLQEKVLAATSTGSTYGTIVAIDIYGNALYKSGVLTKLASEDAGYDIEVSYGNVVWTNATETIEGVTVKDGVITVPKGNEQLAKEITGTVKVTYTYKYAWVPVEKDGKVTGYERKKFSFDIPVAFKNAPQSRNNDNSLPPLPVSGPGSRPGSQKGNNSRQTAAIAAVCYFILSLQGLSPPRRGRSRNDKR